MIMSSIKWWCTQLKKIIWKHMSPLPIPVCIFDVLPSPSKCKCNNWIPLPFQPYRKVRVWDILWFQGMNDSEVRSAGEPGAVPFYWVLTFLFLVVGRGGGWGQINPIKFEIFFSKLPLFCLISAIFHSF